MRHAEAARTEVAPRLERGDVHVWIARTGGTPAALEALLDPAELERLAAFRRREDRERFLLGCALSRLSLGHYTGESPTALELDRRCPDCGRPHGKPRLVQAGAKPLELSVSHSGELVAVAVGRSPVGVDLEHLRVSLDADGIAHLVLADSEREEYDRTAAGERLRHLLVYWTRKEAVTKALGLGLRVPLVELVTTPPSEEPELCSWSLEPEPSTIAMRDLRLGPDYVGAVAVHGALDTLSVIDAGPLLERGAATHAFAGRAMKRVRA